MSETVDFSEIGRLPLPGDNVAIATRTLPVGTIVERDGVSFALSHTVMEGHRFACAPIEAGGELLSWELPFGVALVDLAPGDYVANEKMLAELRIRNLDFELPAGPNFRDVRMEYVMAEETFVPGEQVDLVEQPGTFQGYDRGPARGSGTRNFIVVMGTTSLTGSFAKQLAARFKNVSEEWPNVDGVVAVAHTEGGTDERQNNHEIVMRTLAGFMVHSNVGAILAVDSGSGPIDNDVLKAFLEAGDYPLADVPHAFFRHERGLGVDLDRAEKTVGDWLPAVNACERTDRPLAHLKLAMQCGGSDAFSGISGNPLSSEVAKTILRHGGSANLAETTELIGAENYVLNNVRDLETARAFLGQIERYDALARRHGQSAEGNPSGGNLYRGLYNIVVKSIGAAMKKHPDVRLDRVVEYGERMDEPGYYFMDSAGNDLESIAGQVACGCNVVHFITGNGSITNFPFVPTVKIVTTSGRYELLRNEMDIDAGRYLDGEPMERLAKEAFDYTVEVASGLESVGEAAGHSQVQLWREWRQTGDDGVEKVLAAPVPDGRPLALAPQEAELADIDLDAFRIPAWRIEGRVALERIGLIAPTSLCAGQIAAGIAERLSTVGPTDGIDRFVALPHTEGCGTSRGYAEDLFVRTMIGYLRHPSAARALLLEHGCEKTHNDEFRVNLRKAGLDASRFGWASIQNDGGIEAVTTRVMNWFEAEGQGGQEPERTEVGLEGLCLGLAAVGPIPAGVARGVAAVVRAMVGRGGSVVIGENVLSLASKELSEALFGENADVLPVSLAYGQGVEQPGLHLMDTPTRNALETVAGLGGCGVNAVVALGRGGDPGHPMLPVIQCVWDGATDEGQGRVRLDLEASQQVVAQQLVAGLVEALQPDRLSSLSGGLADFQITRGWLGISL